MEAKTKNHGKKRREGRKKAPKKLQWGKALMKQNGGNTPVKGGG